jgi:transcriptional regulator with XRE-family HTH domain
MQEAKKENPLGTFVRSRMKELRLTQIQISKRANLSPSHLSGVIGGKVHAGDKILTKLAEALRVKFDDLVDLRISPVQADCQFRISEKLWALCLVLEKIEGKPIEEILIERLRHALSSRSS